MIAVPTPRRTALVGASLLANPGCSAEHRFREQACSYNRVDSATSHQRMATPQNVEGLRINQVQRSALIQVDIQADSAVFVGASLLANPGCSAAHNLPVRARAYGHSVGSPALVGITLSARQIDGRCA